MCAILAQIVTIQGVCVQWGEGTVYIYDINPDAIQVLLLNWIAGMLYQLLVVYPASLQSPLYDCTMCAGGNINRGARQMLCQR